MRRWRSSSSGRKRHYSFDSLEPPAGSPHQIIYASSTSSPSHQHHHHHHRNQSDYNIPTDYDHHQRQQIIPSGSSQMAPVSAAPSYNSPTPSPASLLSSSSSSSRPAGDHHHYHHDTNIIPYLPQSSAGGSRHTYSNFTPAAALNSAARGHRRTLSSPAVPAIFPPPSTTSPSSPLLTYKFTDPAAATNTSAKYYSASNSPHASSNTKTHLALQIQPSFSYKIPDECTTTAAPYSSVDQKKEADIHQHSLPAVSYKRLRSENPASSPEQVPSIHLPAVLQLHQQLENQSTASLASESTATTPSSGVGSSFNGHQRNLSWNGSDDVFNNNGTHVIGHPVAPAIKRPSGFSIRDLLG